MNESQALSSFAGLACGVLLIGFLVGVAILVAIILLLSSFLKRVPETHRKMQPGMVWLLVIPLFNIVWNFFVYRAISESYESYFASHGRSEFGDCGKTIGLVYSICCCLCIIPFLNLLAGPAALILWIIYVIKLIGLKNQIPA